MPNPLDKTPIEIERGWERNDVQVRILYGMDTFAERKAGTYLDILHYYWSSLQIDSNRLPTVAEFRLQTVLPEFENHDIGLVDTTADAPVEFVMQHHPASTVPGWGRELSGKKLGDYPNKMHAKSLTLEFRRCKTWKLPHYHEIDQVIDGVARHYTRLMVPAVDDHETMVRNYYTVRWLAPQKRVSTEG